ncbi:MAG: hypothetical protein K0S41_3021 [Anaerocolumna sp.]|jgi:hypothetical protein|nr:hypothetical protein [Anaerocolumna sp.]
MLEILSIIGVIGFYTIWITPLTLVTGLINANIKTYSHYFNEPTRIGFYVIFYIYSLTPPMVSPVTK